MIEIDSTYLLDRLKKAIGVNSITPHEEPFASFLADEMQALGLEVEWQEVAPGRPNVMATAELGPADSFITLTGHTDTVAVAANWPSDPFTPIEKDGRLYGLGALDMKGGDICGLAAAKALLEAGHLHGRLGRLGLAFVVDEEGLGLGAKALLNTDYARSDLMLLGEPYYGYGPGARELPLGLNGKVLYRITVRGKMSHALRPEGGINAVEDAARIVAALDRLPLGQHPRFGFGNYSTLKIEGGYKEYAVVVPELCEVVITRLTVPGEDRASALADMHSLVDSLDLESEVTIETPPPYYEPYYIEADSELVQSFTAVYERVLGVSPTWTTRRGITDANIYLGEGGIPTLTFGPNGQGAHEAGEYVEIATLAPVATVYAQAVLAFSQSQEYGGA